MVTANNGFQYIMCVIDVYTKVWRKSFFIHFNFSWLKKLWMAPLKRITCSNSIEVFEKLLNSINGQPEKIQTDMVSLEVKISVQTNC